MGRLARIALKNVGSVLEKNNVIMLMDPVPMDVTLAIKELCVQKVATFIIIKKPLLLMFNRHPYIPDIAICKLSKHYELL